MRNLSLLPLLALLAGCHHEAADPAPTAPTATNYDELALARGHWEWERSSIGFSGTQSPATVGYTRQLVFQTGGKVTIGHDGRMFQTTDYQLSMGTLAGCGAGQPSSPIITFTNEDGIKAGPRKAYSIRTSNGQQTLSLIGDYACVDGGAYEDFHWVAE